MNLTLNGSLFDFNGNMLLALLEKQGIQAGQGGIAVAVNERVVPRSRWGEVALQAGDRIEIVRAIAGG